MAACEIMYSILPCNSGLIPHSSHDHGGEILQGAPDRGRLIVILCFFHL